MKKKTLCVLLLLITSTLMACSNKSLLLNEKDASAVGLTKEDSEEIRNILNAFTEDAKNKDKASIEPYFAINEYIDGYNMDLVKDIVGEDVKKPAYEEVINNIDTKFELFQFGFEMTDEIGIKLEANELDSATIKELIDKADLTTLKILRIDTPMKETSKTNAYKEMIASRCKAYGAENIVYLTVLYEVKGQTYYCGFSLYKYDEKWKIYELSCSGNTYVNDSVVVLPCTKEMYLGFVGNKK